MASATAGIFGIGKGDAQVIGPNQGLAMLQRSIAEDERKRAAEDAQIQSQLAKVNFDGARNADTDYLFEGYNKLRQTNAQLRATKNPAERNKLMQDMQGQQQQLLSAVNLSKQANLGEQKYAQLRLDRHNELKDDYGQKYSDLIGTSIFDPTYQKKAPYFSDPFIATFDMAGLAKKVQDRALNTVKGKAYTKQLAGGATQWGQDEITRLDENAAKNLLIQEIASQPSLRKNVMAEYASKAETPEAATQLFINDFLDGLRAKNKTEFKQTGFQAPERPDKFYEHQDYLNRQKQATAANNDDGRDEFITALQQKDTQARGDLIRSVNRAGGRYSTSKNGFTVIIPTPQKVNKTDENGKTTTVTEMQDKIYTIGNDASEKSKENISALLNQVDLFKPRPLYEKKSNPYGSTPQSKPATSSSTTTKVSSSSSSTMTTVQLPDGRTGQIPASKLKDFLKQYPKAKKL